MIQSIDFRFNIHALKLDTFGKQIKSDDFNEITSQTKNLNKAMKD